MANTEQKPQKYTIKAEVEFAIEATSIQAAYKLFERYMVNAFESAHANGVDHPPIYPCGFEGLAVTRENYHVR
jgi:hypothetical protein